MRTLLLALTLVACSSDPAAPPLDAPPVDVAGDAVVSGPDVPCGGACGAGTVCEGGRCVAAPVDAGADASPCPAGFALCGSPPACTDLSRSREHCGGCQFACHPWGACVAGRCSDAESDGGVCPARRGDCNQLRVDECEVDVAADRMHCGACNRACAAGQRCTDGVCG